MKPDVWCDLNDLIDEFIKTQDHENISFWEFVVQNRGTAKVRREAELIEEIINEADKRIQNDEF